EGIIPHDRSKTEGTVDEERRLFYVGITRAMVTLTLSWCNGRMRYGSAMPAHISSFIKEIDPQHVEETTAEQILNKPLNEEGALGVLPSRSIQSRNRARATGSRPAQTSSASRREGRVIRARPTSTFWRSPWLKTRHGRCLIRASPNLRQMRMASERSLAVNR